MIHWNVSWSLPHCLYCWLDLHHGSSCLWVTAISGREIVLASSTSFDRVRSVSTTRRGQRALLSHSFRPTVGGGAVRVRPRLLRRVWQLLCQEWTSLNLHRRLEAPSWPPSLPRDRDPYPTPFLPPTPHSAGAKNDANLRVKTEPTVVGPDEKPLGFKIILLHHLPKQNPVVGINCNTSCPAWQLFDVPRIRQHYIAVFSGNKPSQR